jgi:hypothetical protein
VEDLEHGPALRSSFAGHLAAAVEKIVAAPGAAPRAVSTTELRQNFDSAVTATRELEVRH